MSYNDSTTIIREYLDSLSRNITPKQLNSLLDGTQNDDLIKLNEIVVQDLNVISLVKDELSSPIALAILFKYLDDFISRNILNELIFDSVNQSTDPCFIKISVVDSEQRQILQDFLNTSVNPTEPLSDQLNALTNFVNELCATIDNVVNLGRPGSIESLLSDFDKSSLLGLVDGNIQSATALQDSEKKEALDLTSTVLQDFDDYVSGINTKELQSSLPNIRCT